MFYGVQQSTDMRYPMTKIKKFTAIKALRKWIKNTGDYTYDDPEQARNYHRDFRYGYELKERINKKDPIFNDLGTRDYPQNDNDRMANYLYKYGDKIYI